MSKKLLFVAFGRAARAQKSFYADTPDFSSSHTDSQILPKESLYRHTPHFYLSHATVYRNAEVEIEVSGVNRTTPRGSTSKESTLASAAGHQKAPL